MRIHLNTDALETLIELRKVIPAGISFEKRTIHGSRSHKNAVELLLSGSNPRNANGHAFKAATFDEWGITLAAIFKIDPTASTRDYRNAMDFYEKTFYRFTDGPIESIHNLNCGHTWLPTSHPRVIECPKCGAKYRRN